MDGSNDPSYCQSIPPTNLTVVVDPDNPSLDIIFIHGFTGHPERTWTHRKGDVRRCTDKDDKSTEPPSKIRKLNPFSTGHQKDFNTTTYWPRDLIPDTVPDARVLSYGYDTNIRHKLGPPVNQNTVYDIAWDFLVALESERRIEPLRPALFIVHSLGGIVVKEMLRRSSGCRQGQTHLQDIFKSTIGIVFFGTPHGGADPRGFLHRVAEKVIKAAGFSVNEQIVNTLLPSSERLRELRDEFCPIAHERNWIIHSFQEQLGVTSLGGHKVVEDTSSYLNLSTIEISEHIGRNHMDMCRFTGPNDIEYRKVASALRRIIGSVFIQPKLGEKLPLNEEQKKILLESLKFDQIDARQMTIKNAHAKTCKWLLKNPQYVKWLNATAIGKNHGFDPQDHDHQLSSPRTPRAIWLKGKPGTGKSTLMKFALAHVRNTRKDRIVISFFFNARGESLEKSTMGTYRSLLLQLLERLPTLQRVFDSLGLSTSNIDIYHRWSIESLKALLGQAIQSLGGSSVVCFIDALDECEEAQIRDIISFLEHVGELAVSGGIKFQVCFSSRHYPHITMQESLDLILERQEGHNQDITNYLDTELKIGQSKVAEQIRKEVQEKASGIFIWVVLVVGILNKEHDGGRTHVLRRRLREIPSDLYELFRNILTRDSNNREELVLCIQWVLFSKQPLSPEQLYFAILSGVEPEIPSWDVSEITKDVIQRFILNSSKGLVEITTSKIQKVQFIHESVKDFLLKENELGNIWPNLGSNLQGESHKRLNYCCLQYMSIDLFTHLEIPEIIPKASSQEAANIRLSVTNTFPFLEYAVRNVLYHADVSAEYGIAQENLIQSFPLNRWIKYDNLIEKHEVRRHKENVSLLYILAEGNLSNLIRVHPSLLSCLEVENERYGPPLFASIATGSEGAVRVFMKALAKNGSPNSQLYKLYNQCCQKEGSWKNLGRDFKFSKRRTLISYLAELGEVIFAFILESGIINLDSKDQHGRTPLSWAAEKGHETIVKLLLDTDKVDVDSKDQHGRTPLSWAAENGHETIVKLLLDTDKVDVDLKDQYYGRTPLSWAAENGHETIVKLLLDTDKVDVDSKDQHGRTPLSWAAENGHETIVKLLLDTDKVDVDSKDQDYGRTPLWWAAMNRHETIVKLLLDTDKVDVDSKDQDYGRTPLWWAARNRHETIVKLLLDTDKVDVDLKDQGYGRTPLSWAAENGHETIVKLLLDTDKVDVDSKDQHYGRTPLWWAARNGHETIVKLLLDTDKVDVDSKDRHYGRTPLSWAAEKGHETIVKLLLNTDKVDVDSKDQEYGRTPLSWAAEKGNKTIVKLLLNTDKVDVDLKDQHDGRTPLLWAAKNGYEMIVRLLLDTDKVDVDSKDQHYGRTPLSWAAGNGHETIVKLLLDTDKVDVDSKDQHGWTPLSWAAEKGNETIVKLLLNTDKVDVDLKDQHGRTPLSWAAKNGYEMIVKLLLDTDKVDVDLKDQYGRTPLSWATGNGHEMIVKLLLDTDKVDVNLKNQLYR